MESAKKPSLWTRFAPSPTGRLHLGHVAHMIWVWGVADTLGAAVLVRLEDHDQSRCRSEFERSILEDLLWFGLASAPPSWRQSDRTARYESAALALAAQGLVYACSCSRKEVAAQSGQDDGELRYPGTCRTKNIPLNQPNVSWRLKMPDENFSAQDARHGTTTQNPAHQCGDVVIKDRHGQWTYQFCVVIDDLDQNIHLIVRGDDLRTSVGRQLAMRRLIQPEAKTPLFVHHPLLIAESGQKLSKRDFSAAAGVANPLGWTAPQALGHAAYHAGLAPTPVPLERGDFASILPRDLIARLRNLARP